MCAKAHSTPENAITIVETLAELDAIDRELWQSGLIWCQHLVDNLVDVYRNRKRNPPSKPIVTDKCCFECGKLLVRKRTDAKYCSDNCRIAAHRKELSVTQTTTDNAISTPSNGITTPDKVITTGKNPQSRVEESRVDKSKLNVEIPEWMDKETWMAFLEMRKTMRAFPTAYAQKRIIEKLAQFKSAGEDIREVLNQSIMNNWKGVFSLNGRRGGQVGVNKANPRALPASYTTPEEYRKKYHQEHPDVATQSSGN